MQISPILSGLAVLTFVPALALAGAGQPSRPTAEEGAAMAMTVSSPAFRAGAAVPVRHTCDGEDVSPRLEWTDPPAGTRAFALIVDDPDAPVGDWVHWVVVDIPATARALPEGIARADRIPGLEPARQGRNDFGRLGWGGPCPPPGKAHRYFFKLYALGGPLGLAAGATKAEVEKRIAGRTLAKAEMYGTYARGR